MFGGIFLKGMSSWVDKFCYKHPKFGISRLMLYIVVATAGVYFISLMDRTGTLISFLSFNPVLILRGEVWRVVTWLICPITTQPFSLLISLYFYYFIGTALEQTWGSGRFTIYYIMGFILNLIYGFVIYFATKLPIPINADYLNMSMFFAFAALYPDNQVLLFFIIPIKIKWLALLDAAYFAYAIIANAVNGYWFFALMPIVAILNFFIFCGGTLVSYMRRSRFAGYNSNTIKFKSAAKKAKRQNTHNKTADGRPYRHKCSVCGRTDADFPNLEFRYCSKCQGYHCFCIDHINNHIHFDK